MLSEATLALGRRATTALLGVDALFRAESGDGDGLAVVNLDTDGRYPADGFAGYADARGAFEALRRDAASLPEADRRAYYDQLCGSTLAFIRWREAGLGFQDQLREFLHVPAEPVPEAELEALRGRMRILLDG